MTNLLLLDSSFQTPLKSIAFCYTDPAYSLRPVVGVIFFYSAYLSAEGRFVWYLQGYAGSDSSMRPDKQTKIAVLNFFKPKNVHESLDVFLWEIKPFFKILVPNEIGVFYINKRLES